MRTTAGADAAYANDRPPRDADVHQAHARGRRHHPRQGERRFGHLAQSVRWHQLQSVRHGAFGRHVEQRIWNVSRRQPGHLRDCRGDRRLDPPPDQEQRRRWARADAGTGEPRRHVRRRLQHPHRPNLPHRQGRRHGARRHCRLRPERRAHRLQRRTHARVAVCELRRREAARRRAHRRASRVHGSLAVQRGGRRKHRRRRARHGRPAEARRHDRRPGTERARCCRSTSTSTRRR